MDDEKALRALVAQDLPALERLIDAVGLFPGTMLRDMTQPYLSGGEGDEPGEFWMVAGGDRPSGVLYCAPERMTEDTWNMLLLAVDPENQGSGVGRALVAGAERHLRDGGARLLLVETSDLAEFAGTRAFYQRCGYVEEARIGSFYSAREGKVVFTKTISET